MPGFATLGPVVRIILRINQAAIDGSKDVCPIPYFVGWIYLTFGSSLILYYVLTLIAQRDWIQTGKERLLYELEGLDKEELFNEVHRMCDEKRDPCCTPIAKTIMELEKC